jgi:hypothetical protein
LQVPALQVVWQTPPAQHGCPVAPQDVHVPLEPHTVPPMHHEPAPASAGLFPWQQGCPFDPQAVQLDPEQAVKGAVQAALPPDPQHDAPAVPHDPPEQPPPVHMPWPPGHVVPEPTHVPATQHPPPLQSFPSQQGWFVPPQLAHRPLRPQVFPAAVQKAAGDPASADPASPGTPAQQL